MFPGENLYLSWDNIPQSATPNEGKKAVEQWYGEIKDYYYADPDQPQEPGCAHTGVVGHFVTVTTRV